MFSRSLFHHRPSAILRAIALFALLFVIALATTIAITSRSAARARQLSFEDRVAAQRAIEAVYHRHRIWPTDNPLPKPALDKVLPEAALRASASTCGCRARSNSSRAAPLAPAALQQELERMARQTRSPVLPLPTVLAGTMLKVKDSAGVERLAPLFFVSRDQVNYLVPAGTADGASVVTVTSGDGKLSLGPLPVAAVAPGLFAANANGQGVAAAVALRVRGAAQTFEPVAQFDAATGRFVAAPIDLGPEGDQVILLLYGTGIRGRGALSAVTCTIGGVAVPVGFAAAAPGFVGLDQVNVGPLPRSLVGRGEVDVVLTVDGKVANAVRINVR